MFDPLRTAEHAGFHRACQAFYQKDRLTDVRYKYVDMFAKPSRRKKVRSGIAERLEILRAGWRINSLRAAEVEELAEIVHLQELLDEAPGMMPEVTKAWENGYLRGYRAIRS